MCSTYEASIVLGVSLTTIRRWFHNGKLLGLQDYQTNEIMIHRISIEKLLR